MKKLTKLEDESCDLLAADLELLSVGVAAAFTELNAMIVEKLQPAVSAYNAKLEEAREFVDDVKERMDDYVSERSDKWQVSDAGRRYLEFQRHWSAADMDQIDEVEEIDVPDLDHGGALRELPRAPDDA